MTTRYRDEHYEDVAYIFATRGMPDIVRSQLTGDFAGLFAADNPHYCADCNVRQGEEGPSGRCFEARHRRGHLFVGGFDRKWFLEACGLEEEVEADGED